VLAVAVCAVICAAAGVPWSSAAQVGIGCALAFKTGTAKAIAAIRDKGFMVGSVGPIFGPLGF
jgi:hypothetical protein